MLKVPRHLEPWWTAVDLLILQIFGNPFWRGTKTDRKLHPGRQTGNVACWIQDLFERFWFTASLAISITEDGPMPVGCLHLCPVLPMVPVLTYSNWKGQTDFWTFRWDHRMALNRVSGNFLKNDYYIYIII